MNLIQYPLFLNFLKFQIKLIEIFKLVTCYFK